MTNIMMGRKEPLSYAVIPKTVNGFFDVVRDGCKDEARRLGVTCLYKGPPTANAFDQAEIVRRVVEEDGVHGIALSVAAGNEAVTNEAISFAMARGVPVVTFDSDSPNSERLSYIGTNNFAFGRTLGKILLQLRPKGGKYGIIADQAPNIVERVAGVQSFLDGSSWSEVGNSPADCQSSIDLSLDIMKAYSKQEGVAAVISVGGWPMFHPDGDDRWKSIVEGTFENVTYVNSDAADRQIDILTQGYVHGLVGQTPFQWGMDAIKLLNELATGQRQTVEKEIYSTHFMEMIRVPLNLPKVETDLNHVGNLRYVGFALFIVVFFTSLFFAGWTVWKRRNRIVRASQPIFLAMVCVGTLIMASTIIPQSLDESEMNETRGKVTCMAQPWLASVGFTITFAALFSKTWRINRIYHRRSNFVRMRITPRDVMLPFMLLLSMDLIILILWTILSPLEYVRLDHEGTDEWNRVISTYGTCKGGENSYVYAIMLCIVNMVALVIALFQAYQARSIQSEFAESTYIGCAMAAILQAALIGFPILFLVRDVPQVFYLVIVMLNFVICMAVLCLIFIPKIVRKEETPAQRRKRLRESINLVATPSAAAGRNGRGEGGGGLYDASSSEFANDSSSKNFMALFVTNFRRASDIAWFQQPRNQNNHPMTGTDEAIEEEEEEKPSCWMKSLPIDENDCLEEEGLRLEESQMVSWESSSHGVRNRSFRSGGSVTSSRQSSFYRRQDKGEERRRVESDGIEEGRPVSGRRVMSSQDSSSRRVSFTGDGVERISNCGHSTAENSSP